MSSNEHAPINDPQGSARAFIEPDVKVSKRFGRNVFVVPMGKQGRLFKDGAFVRNLPPGKHRWFDLFANYTVSMVDARVRLLNMIATGTIPGPMEESAPTPPAKVKVPLRISAQLANIETLLNTEDPLSLLTAMITTFITTTIGQLRYDQYNTWVATLRAELERYLQYQATVRTGLQVLEVYIQEPEGQTESDKRQLKLYQTATEIKNRAQLTTAKNQDRVTAAEATAREGDLLGVNPFLIKLSESPEGVEIIKADLELRRMAIAAGMISAGEGTVLPPNPHQMQNSAYTEGRSGPAALGSASMPGSGAYRSNSYTQDNSFGSGRYTPYSADGRASSAYPSGSGADFPPNYTPGPVSGQFRDAPSMPSAPSSSFATPQNTARFAVEVEQLRTKNYSVHETDAVFEDAQGASVRGHEFTVIVGETATITVDAPPGFPQVAPVVWVKWPGARSVRYTGAAVRDWSPSSWLVEVVDEILRTPHE